MSFIYQNPFLRISSAFICGIIAAKCGLQAMPSAIIFCCFVAFQIFLSAHKMFDNHDFAYIKGIAPLILIFCLGCINYNIQNPITQTAITSPYYMCQISTIPVEKPKTYMVNAVLRQAESPPICARLYFEKSNDALQLNIGDKLAVKTTLKAADSNFLLSKGITHSGYVPTKNWQLSEKDSRFNLDRIAAQIRKSITDVFYKYLKNTHAGIVSGLCTGNSSDIDFETKETFSAIGISHILSVSGMHVGIIYLAICKILKFTTRLGRLSVIKQPLTIIAVWAYSFMCGLPPSAVRAAFMFSIMAAAQMFNKKNSSLNTLAFSCFCMLSYNSSYLFNLGFQLSFVAVLGIITIGKTLTGAIHLQNKALKYVCEMTCISVAAQLATAPFCLYYFHEFPNYFLPANIVIVPFASLLIYVGVLLVPLSFISETATEIFARLADFLAASVLKMSDFLAHLPYSQTIGIEMNVFQLALACLLIFCTYLFFTKQNSKFLIANLVCLIILLAENLLQNIWLCK